MAKHIFKPSILFLPALSLALSACGAMNTAASKKTGTPDQSGLAYVGNNSFGSSGSGSTATGTNPAYVFDVQGTGYQSVYLTVSTGRLLKMKFTPGVQNVSASTSSGPIIYTRLGVYLTVGSSTQDTGMLRNGADQLGGAETSGVLDFSPAIAPTCTGSDCRQDVTIQVYKPNYDYWCINFAMYCPWTRVSTGHPWNGKLTIQTDDTVGI